MSDLVEKYRHDRRLRKFCMDEGISYLAVFGSYARDEADEDSDLDLLYRLKTSMTYFQFYDLLERLTAFFGKKIDAISVNHLRESFRQTIADNVGVLYEEEEYKK